MNYCLQQDIINKIIQSGGFLGRLLGPLLKNWITIDNKCN